MAHPGNHCLVTCSTVIQSVIDCRSYSVDHKFMSTMINPCPPAAADPQELLL